MIEEAEIVEENKSDSEGESLMDRLRKETEFKQPPPGNSGNSQSSQESTNTNAFQQKKSGAKWNESDFEEEKKPPQNPEQPQQKVSEQDKKASAEIATGMLDLGLVSIFTPIEKYKFKKHFTKDEYKRIKSIQYADKNTLSPEDLAFREKVEVLLKSYKEKKEEIELDSDEIRRHERAFYVYFDSTNTKLSPSTILWASLATTIGGRIASTLIDD